MALPEPQPLTKEEFPEAYTPLTIAQIERIRAFAKERKFKKGEILFEEGIRNAPLHVLLDGKMGAYQNTGCREVLVAEIGKHDFTGDIAMMSGTATLAFGRAHEDITTLEVSSQNLKRLLVEDSEISDVIVSTFIRRRAALTSRGLSPIQIIGSKFSRDTYRIREFLIKNAQPFNWLDTEKHEETEAMLEYINVKPEETPVIVYRGTCILKNPANHQIAKALGINDVSSDIKLYDVAVIGAGPGGLAASVNAASDGLNVITVDSQGPGGQSASSSKIENYLGFPMGVSGQELAERAAFQAQKFGVRIAANQTATALEQDGDAYNITLCSGDKVKARSVVISTGAQYQKLDIEGLEQFEGESIFYGATNMEGQLCKNKNVALIGAGNSAGQGAVFLSQHASHVYMIVRRDSLEYNMSRYLIRRIEESPNITILFESEVKDLKGEDGQLESIKIVNRQTGEEQWQDVFSLFSFIGAKPYTKWLSNCIALDENGFIKTGTALSPAELVRCGWQQNRMPDMFETALPRVYAVGDVRSTSSKRVAAAVGEGSMCIGFVYRALNE